MLLSAKIKFLAQTISRWRRIKMWIFMMKKSQRLLKTWRFSKGFCNKTPCSIQQSSINSNRTETTTIDTGEIREQIIVPTQDQEESQETSVCYDVESFIIEIECFPCLWNTSTRSHHDQNMRINAWEEL